MLSDWQTFYPLLIKAVLVLLGAVMVWVVFKGVLKRVRKRVQKYEFVRAHDEIFGLIRKAVLYALVFVSGIYIVNLFKIPMLEKVFYAGLADHVGHELAARQQSAFGGVLSFRVRGGREEAWRLIDATRLMSLTANLGDAKTTIVHPASTTHGRLTAALRPGDGYVVLGLEVQLTRRV